MHTNQQPIHKLTEEIIKELTPMAEARGLRLSVLADPELAYWYSPYPEAVIRVTRLLVENLISIAPSGAMTVLMEPVSNAQDTLRLEFQIEGGSHGVELDDFSLKVLDTDNLSTEINLLGIDSQRSNHYLLGYDLNIPLLKNRQPLRWKSEPNSHVDKPNHSNLRVLVVDDNTVNRLVVSKFLTRWGMIVDQAYDGQKALNSYQVSEYDVVLMDLEMPVMDGFEATRKIREFELESGLGRHTPIIALTAFTMVEAKEKALGSGMNDFLAKPLDPNQLYNKIIHLIGEVGMQVSA